MGDAKFVMGFAIVIWALLYATIIAPIVFKYVLQKYLVAQAAKEGGDVEAAKHTLDRAGTLHGALPDIIAEEEKADQKLVRQKCEDLENEAAAKDQEIAALRQRIAGMESEPLPKEDGLHSDTIAIIRAL